MAKIENVLIFVMSIFLISLNCSFVYGTSLQQVASNDFSRDDLDEWGIEKTFFSMEKFEKLKSKYEYQSDLVKSLSDRLSKVENMASDFATKKMYYQLYH